MPFDLGRPAMSLRRDLKVIAREILTLYSLSRDADSRVTALGLDYSVDQGTYPADPEAQEFLALLPAVMGFMEANAPAITKAADIGDNIQ